ncbi:hypothetical protein GQ44DRAFT_793138 [Phaeosphaeriaceae sp. PMI808]|nr:hypothetical protein GQ44DRAFT_793138 [Phaeosphaeriaceae sp. PMI808]
MAIIFSVFILLLNMICAIVVSISGNPSNGIATAYTGDCQVISRWTTGLHLLINVLSSILLAASNYCMQRLIAPTRSEIDKAHSKRMWLDIGVPSLRNLPIISWKRLTLWVLLAMSSIPLHLLYNSIVFGTVATNSIDFLTVTPNYFTTRGGWQTYINGIYEYNPDYYQPLQDMVLEDRYLDRTLFENLTGIECYERYNAPFIYSGNCFAVLTVDKWNRSSTGYNTSLLDHVSLKGSDMRGRLIAYPSDISYCLSEILPPKCRVQISQHILYIVIACNAVKVLLMAIFIWKFHEETIVTIGDAIKSFLAQPDNTTKDCCLMSIRTVDKVWKQPEVRYSQQFHRKKRDPWFNAVSSRRWCLFFLLDKLDATRVVPCPMNKFGNVNFDNILQSSSYQDDSVIPYVMLANLPQTIVSILYFSYNGIFSCMLANREWTGYAVKRASLRVTNPSPGQRSTYFLSLPFTYSIPLLFASILLHWFVSQSIFMGRIDMWASHIRSDEDRYGDKVPYSTYPRGVPIGGTNSAVLSAACHVSYKERGEILARKDLANRTLKWGVTIKGTRNTIGHCCFSDREVNELEDGCLYAGAM